MGDAKRFPAVDAYRGLAIAGVVVFHLVWDLEFAGFVSGLADHPVWLAFGRSLAGSFMLLVGVGLALASRSKMRWRSYLKRLAKILAAAATITVASYFVFPQTFIYFGILHSIAVATLLGTAFMRSPIWLCLLAGVCILIAPMLWQSAMFDSRWTAWIGFSSVVPPSNDFVPVFPWSGLTLFGLGIARAVLDGGGTSTLASAVPKWMHSEKIVWLGRNSLVVYLLHQPIMLGLILPLSWMLLK